MLFLAKYSEMLIWYSEMLIWYSRMHRVQILRNGSSKDPQMAYMSQITRYIDTIYFLGSSKKYAAYKCKYHDFNPSKILILAIFGYLHTLMTKNLKNGSSETPQMRYNRYITRYTDIIQSSRLFNQIICSQLANHDLAPLKPKFGTFCHIFAFLGPKI